MTAAEPLSDDEFKRWIDSATIGEYPCEYVDGLKAEVERLRAVLAHAIRESFHTAACTGKIGVWVCTCWMAEARAAIDGGKDQPA
jgi:hypothetical protein